MVALGRWWYVSSVTRIKFWHWRFSTFQQFVSQFTNYTCVWANARVQSRTGWLTALWDDCQARSIFNIRTFFSAAFVATEPGKPIECYRDDVFFIGFYYMVVSVSLVPSTKTALRLLQIIAENILCGKHKLNIKWKYLKLVLPTHHIYGIWPTNPFK